MFTLPHEILRKQCCHIVTHYKSYMRLLTPALICILASILLYTFDSVNSDRPAIYYISMIFFACFGLIYLANFQIQSFRLIILGEEIKNVFFLKHLKQLFLYASYNYLLMLYTFILVLLILGGIAYLFPSLITDSVTSPINSELTQNISQALTKQGIHVNYNPTPHFFHISLGIFIISNSIINSLLIFNVAAITSDVVIPFYRIMWQASNYIFSNFIFSLALSVLTLLIVYFESSMQTQPLSIQNIIAMISIQIIQFFILMCFAQSFKLWHSTKEGAQSV